MKAIVLAAGEGKRLRPLTDQNPKCMVKLFGKSILQWQIDTFRQCNINDISVVTGYRSESITIPNITYFKNEKFDTTNMLETLFCARDKLIGSVIVSYGDIIFEEKVLRKLIESNYDYSICVDKNWKYYWETRFENPLKDAESLSLDESGYIASIGQKVDDIDEIEGQYIGLMKFQNGGLEFLKNFYNESKRKSLIDGSNPLNPTIPFEKSFMTDLLQGLINSGCNLKSIIIENGWLELDTLRDFEIYEKMYADNTLHKFITLQK